MSKLSSILKKNIELLIGNYDLNQDLFLPFDKKIIDFFDELSKTILSKNLRKILKLLHSVFGAEKIIY